MKYYISALLPFFFKLMVVPELLGQNYSTQELTDSIEAIIYDKKIPGLSVAVMSSDSVLYQSSFGFSDLSTGRKVNVASRFLQGSVTKTFTAMAIMSLVQSGKLNLDDKLKDIAPEIPFHNSWEKTRPILIKHILEHKAGFDDMHLNTFAVGEGVSMTALEKALVYQNSFRSRWEPGLVSSYSNPGYAILGFIIEKISGMPYRDFVRQSVLDPLGMDQSLFISEIDGDSDNIAKAHEFDGEAYVPIETYEGPNEAGGGLLSSQMDMVQFVQYLLNREKQDSIILINTDLMSDMESLHSWFELDNDIQYGYGLGLDLCDSEINSVCYIGHSGGLRGASSHFLYNRDYDIGIAIANNGGNSNRKIIELLLCNFVDKAASVSLKWPSISNQEVDSKDWDGYYYPVNERNGIYSFINAPFNTIKLKGDGDKVKISYLLEGANEYHRLGATAYYSEGEINPGVYLTKTHGEPSLYFYQTYHKKVNGFVLTSLRSIGVTAIIGSLLLVLLSIIQLIGSYKYPSWRRLSKYSLLVASPILLVLISVAVLASQSSLDALESFSKVGFNSGVIFITTIAMPFMSLFSIYYLFKNSAAITSKILVSSYALISVSGVVLISYCVLNGWFAFRIWAY